MNEFEQKDNDTSLEAFLDYIASLEEIGGVSGAFFDFDHAAVNILTAYAAKELEFDHVFCTLTLLDGEFLLTYTDTVYY